MKAFVVIAKDIDGDEVRWLHTKPTTAEDIRKNFGKKYDGILELVDVVALSEDLQIVDDLIRAKLELWSLSLALEKEIGIDLDNLGGALDYVIHRLDRPPGPTKHEELAEVLDYIKENG